MSKITYDDKITIQDYPDISERNKVMAEDMNEIKYAINDLYDSASTFVSWDGRGSVSAQSVIPVFQQIVDDYKGGKVTGVQVRIQNDSYVLNKMFPVNVGEDNIPRGYVITYNATTNGSMINNVDEEAVEIQGDSYTIEITETVSLTVLITMDEETGANVTAVSDLMGDINRGIRHYEFYLELNPSKWEYISDGIHAHSWVYEVKHFPTEVAGTNPIIYPLGIHTLFEISQDDLGYRLLCDAATNVSGYDSDSLILFALQQPSVSFSIRMIFNGCADTEEFVLVNGEWVSPLEIE